MSESDNRLLLLADMKTMKEVFALRAGVEVARERNGPRLQPAFLGLQDEIAERDGLIRILPVAGGAKEIDGGNRSEGDALQLVLGTIGFRPRWRILQTFDRKFPVVLRRRQAAMCQLRIAISQYTRGECFIGGDPEISL